MLTQFDQFCQGLAYAVQWIASQAIVAAQLKDDNIRAMAVEQCWQALFATGGGFSTHTGVDELHLIAKLLIEQGYPALLGVHAVGGAQAVAEY